MREINRFWRFYIRFKGFFIPEGPMGDRSRGRLYEPFLKKVGKNFKVASQVMIYSPNELEVGDDVYIGFNSYLGKGEILLEDEVLIGNFVSITASNHKRKNGSFRFGGFNAKKIVIGEGTWLCAHTCILAGVRIGKGALVAAGSVVTKSFGDNLIIGGVPSKIIKEIGDE